jgi:hypothetical protein
MTTAVATLNERQEMQELFDENMAGAAIDMNDLIKVKVPAGGGTTWEVPTGEGEDTEATKTITGVIIAQMPFRIHFPGTYGDEKSAPDCQSPDGITGYGTPGGACKTCPLAKFGSKGKGQACAAKVALYIMRDDDFLPICITLPPSSTTSLRKYMLQLTTVSKKPFYAVKTKVSLKKVENANGQAYSIVQFALAEKLDADEAASMKDMKDMFVEMLHATARQKADNEPTLQAGFTDEEFTTYQKPAATKASTADDEPTF